MYNMSGQVNFLMYVILSMVFFIKILFYLEDLIFYQLLMFHSNGPTDKQE